MQQRTIQRVLVACRGEPAAAIGRRLEGAGVEVVAVFSEADAEDAWLDDVSYAAPISADPGADPYRDGLRLVSAALDAGCDALHAGDGEMARSAELAHMTMNVGLAWLGSPPGVLEACRDRGELRRHARELGIPVVQSSPPLLHPDDAEPWLARLGGPLRVVPMRGGRPERGGRAPRVIEDVADFTDVARHIKGLAFTVERSVRGARHVVVGVVGDGAGHALHLGDHERSLALGGRVRVRECPAPALDDTHRARLTEAAVRLAREVKLAGIGAVEFLVGADGRCWFHDLAPGLFPGWALHDEIYGLELAYSQVRLAAGENLGWSQEEIGPSGVAIELVVCATAPGELTSFSLPDGSSTARAEGALVDPQRDPVLARLLVAGPMRHALLVRARGALEHLRIEGVPHDTDVLLAALAHPEMWDGRADASLLDRVAGGAEAEPGVL